MLAIYFAFTNREMVSWCVYRVNVLYFAVSNTLMTQYVLLSVLHVLQRLFSAHYYLFSAHDIILYCTTHLVRTTHTVPLI